ncbi:MAG: Protein-export rane protein SecF [Ilumatobacteraceae bacterium]|nr:Protein-export rane protein SecF [Ilumatobacteraceae bacterium]
MTASIANPSPELPVRRNVFGRLYHGETRMDFMGRKWWGLGISGALIVITIVSLFAQGLNLGLDFKGGVQWEVPAAHLTEAQARSVLNDNGVNATDAKIVHVTASGVDRLRIQVGEQSTDEITKVYDALAVAAQVDKTDISANSVTSSWGAEITDAAVRALIAFVILVSMFIAWRFEWRMALAAIAAMLHDVLISVGVYSVLQLEVTPATVIAFLTILGFSLYDTIVVFDKVKENTARYGTARLPYDDVINVSMNQVLMRSLNTSVAAVLPVLSLLVVGAGILGAIALREFALALFVGLITGSYSSIFIAAPILAELKSRSPKWKGITNPRATGTELELLVLGGSPALKREVQRARQSGAGDAEAAATVRKPATTDELLSHPPRPRKKTRR